MYEFQKTECLLKGIHMKNNFLLYISLFIILSLSACIDARSLCKPGEITYNSRSNPFPDLLNQDLSPQSKEIKNRTINFDHVISGQLCNNQLSGVIYVGCDLEIYEWESQSNFLDDCNFSVEDGTIIYVAAHKNRAYYRGCESCHMSQE